MTCQKGYTSSVREVELIMGGRWKNRPSVFVLLDQTCATDLAGGGVDNE